MPFIRTNVHHSTSAAERSAIAQGIHQALIEAIGMPEDELFNMVVSYQPEDFFFSKTFNGYTRSDRPVVIEITMRRGRSDAMKKEVYQLIAHKLHTEAQVATSDVFIFVHENDYSDWSVGGGQFAMAITQQVGPMR